MVKYHYRGLVEGYGSDYKFFGKLLVLCTIICGIMVKVMSCVMYFAPVLGLFNLLHHYQGKIEDSFHPIYCKAFKLTQNSNSF